MSKYSRYEVQGALNGLWFDYYTEATPEERVQLAEDVIEEYYEGEQYESRDEIIENAIRAPRFKSVRQEGKFYSPHDRLSMDHPQFSQKEYNTLGKLPMLEILSDFILRAEKDETRMTKSRELDYIHDDEHKKRLLYFHDDDINEESGERVAQGDITEELVYDIIIEQRDPVTSEQVKAELAHVKQHPEFYALTFAEDYGKDYEDTLRRIQRIDLDRVRTCHQCDDGFYAHDRRRKVCDRRQGLLTDGTLSSLSMCELNYKKNEESWRIKGKRQ